MAKLADELKERYEIREIAIHHRVGRVELGEPSVVIAVSAAHRADALAACKDAIDILKDDASRSGRKRSTRAARSGSGAAPDQLRLIGLPFAPSTYQTLKRPWPLICPGLRSGGTLV